MNTKLMKAGFSLLLLTVLIIGLSTAATARGPRPGPSTDCPTATCPFPNGLNWAGTCTFVYGPASVLECAQWGPNYNTPTCYDPNNCHWQ